MKIFRTALAVLLLGATCSPVVIAREINSNPARQDAVSFHGGNPACYAAGYVAGCEVAVDDVGNFLPTVANAQDLGTSALPFRTVYSQTATITGSDSAGTAGTTLATGLGGTAASQSAILGLSVNTQAVAFALTASSVTPVNSSLMLVGGVAASTTLTSQPEVSTTTIVGGSTLLPFGTFLVITSTMTGANIVYTSSTTSNATGLILGAATRTITKNKALWLWLDNISSPAVWRELLFSNL